MKLYHYTDQNGFMGILGCNELWATKIQHLNDDNEYQLAFEIAEKYIDELLKNESDPAEEFRLKRFKGNFYTISNLNVCVCSLSTEGDLLSQWRGYSNSLGGYSIGFDADVLEKSAEKEGFKLRQCIYDREEQERVVNDIIDNILRKYKGTDVGQQEDFLLECASDCADELCDKLAEISPIIKDRSFKEEGEWRLISKAGINFKNLDFRAGASMLTPFYKIQLKPDSGKLITDVIVGHTPHLELAVKATEAFIYKTFQHVYLAPEVHKSSIPFRNW
ncbi:TPA: DUF2971 domain-containing protein [Vibrio parahaemolyticus]|nr:DUF2971 domain-containing protein [Vibrio parahaemolyticus]